MFEEFSVSITMNINGKMYKKTMHYISMRSQDKQMAVTCVELDWLRAAVCARRSNQIARTARLMNINRVSSKLTNQKWFCWTFCKTYNVVICGKSVYVVI